MSGFRYNQMKPTASLPPADEPEAASTPAPKPPAPDPASTLFAQNAEHALGAQPGSVPMVLERTADFLTGNAPSAPQAQPAALHAHARRLQANMAPTPTGMG